MSTRDSLRLTSALITQAQMTKLAGSEVLTYELAVYLAGAGVGVTVATHEFSPVWADMFEAVPLARIVRLHDPEFEEGLRTHPPDLAWIHHQIVPELLLRNPGKTRFVFNHMSWAHPLEFPFSPDVERAFSSVSVFTAQETLDIQRASALLDGIDPTRLLVLGNPAPDDYARVAVPKRVRTPRLLVVTNHLVDELVEALRLVGSSVRVTLVGQEKGKGALHTRVTSEMVHEADAIVSIGKTVQYGIVAGVPVYCYDHFGGPGWLDPSNFEKAREFNFSGRSFDHKPARTIAQEIVDGFATARENAQSLRKAHQQEFLMSRRIAAVFDAIEKNPSPVASLDERSIAAHLAVQEVIAGYVRIAVLHEHLAARNEGLLGSMLGSRPVAVCVAARASVGRALSLSRRLGLNLVRGCRPVALAGWAREVWMVRMRAFVLSFRAEKGSASGARGVKVAGLLRVRNASLLMQDTLDHLAGIVDVVFVFDDASDDDTVDIALRHPIVAEVIRNRKRLESRRVWEETAHRRAIYGRAKRYKPEWYFCTDADERYEGEIHSFLVGEASTDIAGLRVSFLDAYPTPRDRAPFQRGSRLLGFRRNFGPERRDVLVAWRASSEAVFSGRDGRQPQRLQGRIATRFWCQHYDKALSESVHTESDFGSELIPWEKAKSLSIRL